MTKDIKTWMDQSVKYILANLIVMSLLEVSVKMHAVGAMSGT